MINIVKKAKRENARVRASGAKHSWNHWVWGVDNIDEKLDDRCYTNGETGNIDYFIAMVVKLIH